MTTLDTVTSEAETFAPAVAPSVADAPSAKKFAVYCQERDIRQVIVLVPNALGDMLKAIEARDSLKESDLVRNILGASVNFYALTRVQYAFDNPEWDYVAPWMYTPPAPKAPQSTAAKLAAAKQELSDAQREIEELKAALAAAKATIVPTPPRVIVDSKGRITQL